MVVAQVVKCNVKIVVFSTPRVKLSLSNTVNSKLLSNLCLCEISMSNELRKRGDYNLYLRL